MSAIVAARHTSRLLLAFGLTVAIHSATVAQQSEFQATRFVPVDTCAVISVNMKSILQKMDCDDPLVKKFLDSSEEATGMNFARIDRIITMVSSRASKDPNDPGIPSATLTQYLDDVDPATLVVKNELANSCTFQPEQYNEQEIYVGSYSTPISGGLTNPVLFFPDSRVVIHGDANMIRQMIDGESALSAGMELVNNIDHKAELHMVFEDGRHLTRLLGVAGESVAAGMADMLNGLKRLEIIGDFQRDPPLQITIEMDTPEQAAQLIGLVNAGRLMLPGVFDRLEDQLDLPPVDADDELATLSRHTMRDVISLGRSLVNELHQASDGGTVTISLPQCEGLDQLPQLGGQVLGAMVVQPNQWGAPPAPPGRFWEEVD